MFCALKTLIISCIAIIEIVCFVACHSSIKSEKKDDTTAVLQILLDSAFYKDRLATAARVDLSGPLRDTTIFMRNSILIDHLPKNLLHKLLSEDEMCELMAAHKLTYLQFLELGEFVKTTHGYQTALGTHCMTKGIMQTEPDGISHPFCEREKYCNAVLYTDVTKKGNNLTGSKFSVMTY